MHHLFVYNQIDSVVTGSHLATVFVNICLGYSEAIWLNEYNLNNLNKFYSRYFDDILAAFDNEQDSLNFLNVLNKKHPNIKFMIETKVNHFIAFLDVFTSGINNQR